MKPARVTIVRGTGVGEQTSIEITVDAQGDIFEQLRAGYHALDQRVWTKGLWMQAHVEKLRELPKEVQLGVIEAIDILFGQRQIPEYLLRRLDEARAEAGVETPAESERITEELRHVG